MSKLNHLRRSELDRVVRSGADLILFFYKKNHAPSILGIATMENVDALVAKPFQLYLIDTEDEPEITKAFSVETVPEYVTVKNRRIYKRSSDLLEPSQVLALLKP